MIAALIAIVIEPAVTLEIPGRPLKEVLAHVREQTHLEVSATADLMEQPVVIHADKRPWAALRDDLAWAFDATWVDGRLTRTPKDVQAIEERKRVARQKELDRLLVLVKRQSASWGEWTDEELQRSAELVDLDTAVAPRTVVRQAIDELMLAIGSDALSRLKPGQYFAYPPQAGEKAFPTPCVPILEKAFKAQARFNALSKYPRGQAKQAIFMTSNDAYPSGLTLANGEGRPVAMDYLYAGDTGIDPFDVRGDDTPIDLSDRAESFVSVYRSFRTKPIPPPPDLAAALIDPVVVDPVEVLAGELLLKIAKKENKSLVARTRQFWASRLAARGLPPFTEKQIFSNLQRSDELEIGADTIRTRGLPEVGLIRPRADEREILRHFHDATTSQGLVDAMLPMSGWDSGDASDVLSATRFLNHSINFFSDWPDVFAAVPNFSQRTNPTVISLSSGLRRALDKYLEANPTALTQEHQPTAAELEWLKQNANSVLGSTDGTNNLNLLAKRAFPRGLPDKVEVQWYPPITGYDYQRTQSIRYLIGATEDRLTARPYDIWALADWLYNQRLGKRSESPKFFWTLGNAGGKLVVRFPNQLKLTFELTDQGAHPSEKAQPIAELPKEFSETAEKLSRTFGTTTTAPPPSDNL